MLFGDKALGIPVATTTEIHRKPQHPPEALARARDLLESLDEWGLAAVQSVTMECKSLVIALALLFRKTTVEKVSMHTTFLFFFAGGGWQSHVIIRCCCCFTSPRQAIVELPCRGKCHLSAF